MTKLIKFYFEGTQVATANDYDRLLKSGDVFTLPVLGNRISARRLSVVIDRELAMEVLEQDVTWP